MREVNGNFLNSSPGGGQVWGFFNTKVKCDSLINKYILMFRKLVLLFFFIFLVVQSFGAQVRVRLFSDRATESVLFSVTSGKYEITTFGTDSLVIEKGEPVLISRFNDKVAVKPYNSRGFVCDSVLLQSDDYDGSFSIRVNGNDPVRQYYTGNLSCYSDLGTLLMVNNCDIEQYVAGVVRAEGGTGNNPEYFKSQAVIVRTYLYKYFDRHISDGFNLCDNTHCQVFNGISTDPKVVDAAKETHNLVILDNDSTLIMSPFHSNCGGETSSAQDVWIADLPYLKKIIDPYCILSRNAKWQRSFSSDKWTSYMRNSGFTGETDSLASFNFIQNTRLKEYRVGSFTLPLRTMRTDLNLKSSFFSVKANGDSIILTGRGYGHGVGLCQEGAMVMGLRGFNYKQIIDFYYTGVIISDINNAIEVPPNQVNNFLVAGGRK